MEGTIVIQSLSRCIYGTIFTFEQNIKASQSLLLLSSSPWGYIIFFLISDF